MSINDEAGSLPLKVARYIAGWFNCHHVSNNSRAPLFPEPRADTAPIELPVRCWTAKYLNIGQLGVQISSYRCELCAMCCTAACRSRAPWDNRYDRMWSIYRLFSDYVPSICVTVLLKTLEISFRVKETRKKWRMASSGMLRRVALERTDVSEVLSSPWYFVAACVGC
jgi:hypothetical protein